MKLCRNANIWNITHKCTNNTNSINDTDDNKLKVGWAKVSKVLGYFLAKATILLSIVWILIRILFEYSYITSQLAFSKCTYLLCGSHHPI